MSSRNNRRLRALHRRHAKTKLQLENRIRSLSQNLDDLVAGEADKDVEKAMHRRFKRASRQHADLIASFTDRFPKRQSPSTFMRDQSGSRNHLIRGGRAHIIGETKPTSPVLEKDTPKVHGVNAQRENRSRPKVGGARGKR